MGTITNLTLEGKVEPALMQEVSPSLCFEDCTKADWMRCVQTLDKLNVVSQDVHAVAAKVLLDSLRL